MSDYPNRLPPYTYLNRNTSLFEHDRQETILFVIALHENSIGNRRK